MAYIVRCRPCLYKKFKIRLFRKEKFLFLYVAYSQNQSNHY